MSDRLPFIVEECGAFSPETRRQLLGSAAMIDRLLKPDKVVKGKSFSRSGGLKGAERGINANLWLCKIESKPPL